MRHTMIMAGGSGTRLWPLSRTGQPKQLIPLFDHGRSLLELAVTRVVCKLVPAHCCWICTNESYRSQIIAQLGFPENRILGEPTGRDTVNAVGFAAAVIAREDPDAILTVLTADHIIQPENTFIQALEAGYKVAENNPEMLITYSIVPDHAATGYGYIERGTRINDDTDAEIHVFSVKQYVEKPDQETAERYIAAGNFGWSSGMFCFSVKAILRAIDKYLPETRKALNVIAEAWGSEHQIDILQKVYPHLTRISIDYAIMEPASNDADIPVATIPMQIDWLDVGSWTTFAETIKPDDNLNRLVGKCANLKSRDLLVVNHELDHLIATVGCDDLAIIHTKDATLVCKKDQVQLIKELTGQIDSRYL